MVAIVDCLLAGEAELRCPRRIAEQFGELVGEVGRIVRPVQQAAAGVGDHFGEAAVVGQHDRHGVGHRFERGQAFRFAIDGRRAEDVERLQERDLFGAVELAEVLEPAGEWAGGDARFEFLRDTVGRLRPR